MASLDNIKCSLTEYFHAPVTPEKLSVAGPGTKSIQIAKSIGVLLATEDGHARKDIAEAFGYANTKSLFNAISHARTEYLHNQEFCLAAQTVALKLLLDLK